MSDKENPDGPDKGTAMTVSARDGDRNYKALLDEASELVKQFQGQAVEFYAGLGAAALKLAKMPGTYGNRTVALFADDVTKRTGSEVKQATVYYAMRFCKNFTPKQLEDARKLGLSWRNVQALSGNQLEAPQRDKLLAEIKDGKIDRSEIREAVASMVGGSGGGGGGGGGDPGTNHEDAKEWKRFMAVPDLVNMIMAKIRGTGAVVKAVFRDSDLDKMVVAEAELRRIEETVDELVQVINKEFEAARVAHEKVKGAIVEHIRKSKK